MKIYSKNWTTRLACKSAGAAEYADYIPAEGWDIPTNEYPEYGTKLHLIVRL